MKSIWSGALILVAALAPRLAQAHCDTLDGPVVRDARSALEKRDVAPVLKWVAGEREGAIREAFKRTLAVRGASAEVRALVDRYFFETVVRLHREGEGAPYTGLKSAPPEPLIAKADQALERGSVDALARAIGEEVATGIRRHHQRAVAARKQAGASVAAGRRFVAAYVAYTHYLEGLHHAAAPAAAHAAPGAAHAAPGAAHAAPAPAEPEQRSAPACGHHESHRR